MIMGDSNWSRNVLKNILQFNTTGWGRTEARTNSPVLQQTSLTHYSLSYCSQYFGRQMDHTHICVGSSTSSTCSGDSGGPLTARLQFGREKRVILFGNPEASGSIILLSLLQKYSGYVSYLCWGL